MTPVDPGADPIEALERLVSAALKTSVIPTDDRRIHGDARAIAAALAALPAPALCDDCKHTVRSAAPVPEGVPEDRLSKGEVMDHDGLIWRTERATVLDNGTDVTAYRLYRLVPPLSDTQHEEGAQGA